MSPFRSASNFFQALPTLFLAKCVNNLVMRDRRAVRVAVTRPAPKLEVPKFVRATVGERDAMVNLQPVRSTAANADAIAGVNMTADLTPGPSALDLPSCLPVVVLRLASGATTTRTRELAAVEARLQSHPTSSTGSGLYACRSTAGS
jgi:hypothetical protein